VSGKRNTNGTNNHHKGIAGADLVKLGDADDLRAWVDGVIERAEARIAEVMREAGLPEITDEDVWGDMWDGIWEGIWDGTSDDDDEDNDSYGYGKGW